MRRRLSAEEVEQTVAARRALRVFGRPDHDDEPVLSKDERALVRPIVRELAERLDEKGEVTDGDLLRAVIARRNEVCAVLRTLDLDDVLELIATDRKETP
jgi:hypothetical protein